MWGTFDSSSFISVKRDVQTLQYFDQGKKKHWKEILFKIVMFQRNIQAAGIQCGLVWVPKFRISWEKLSPVELQRALDWEGD